jgi:hypothetical protein
MKGCIGRCVKRCGLLDPPWAILESFLLLPSQRLFDQKSISAVACQVRICQRRTSLEKLNGKCDGKASHLSFNTTSAYLPRDPQLPLPQPLPFQLPVSRHPDPSFLCYSDL